MTPPRAGNRASNSGRSYTSEVVKAAAHPTRQGILKALEKDPRDRLPDAEALAQAFGLGRIAFGDQQDQRVGQLPLGRRRIFAIAGAPEDVHGVFVAAESEPAADAVDQNTASRLGEPTPEKRWLAASLDKTIRLQLGL